MRIFCSICKEIFIPYAEVFVTNCGHLYHSSCILTWTQQNQTCPQCRAALTEPFRVFFDVDKDSPKDPNTLEHELERMSDKLRETEQRNRELKCQKNDFEKVLQGMKDCALDLNDKNMALKTSVKGLKLQLTKMTNVAKEAVELKSELTEYKAKVSALERVDKVIKSSAVEVNNLLEGTPVTALSVKQLCTYVGVLKSQMEKLQTKNLLLSKENMEMKKKASEQKVKDSLHSEKTVKNLKKANSALENEISNLKLLIKQYQAKDKNEGPSSSSINDKQLNNTRKGFSFDVDLSDEENEGSEPKSDNHLKPTFDDKVISTWEELVYTGNRSLGMRGLLTPKQPCRPLKTHNIDLSSARFDETYAFDGLGGRKKVKLGGPTPTEEFNQIKRRKQTSSIVKNQSILNFMKLN